MSEKISGVYVIFGLGNRAYIGESGDIMGRGAVVFARRMGLDWTIVRYMPNSTGRQRREVETKAHRIYREAGCLVTSMDKTECSKIAARGLIGLPRSPEWGRNISAAKRGIKYGPQSPERKAKTRAAVMAAYERLGKEWLHQRALKIRASHRARVQRLKG